MDFNFVEFNNAAQNLFLLSEQTLQGSILNFISCNKNDLNLLIESKKSSLENIQLKNVGKMLYEKNGCLKGVNTKSTMKSKAIVLF